MCARTRWHRSFLFRLRLFKASHRLGISDPPALMMEEMANTLVSHGAGVIVSDSLYMSQHSAVYWTTLSQSFPQVRFLTSVNPRSFQPIIKLVDKTRYKTPGQYVILWNEAKHQCFQIHRPVDKPNEVKYIFSNSFDLVDGAANPHQNPMYRTYNPHYSQCDQFNRDLGGKSFKFMHSRGSSLTARDDFYVTALLLDAFIIWEHCNSPEGYLRSQSFSTFCRTLADDIFQCLNK